MRREPSGHFASAGVKRGFSIGLCRRIGPPLECPPCGQQSLAWLVSPGGRQGANVITTRGYSDPLYGRLSAAIHNAVAWRGMGPEVRHLMVSTSTASVHPYRLRARLAPVAPGILASGLPAALACTSAAASIPGSDCWERHPATTRW